MKNLFFTLTLTLFATAVGLSQATFDLHPDTVSVFVELETTDVEVHNELTNLTGTAREIQWERTIIIANPDSSQTQICDPIACYAYWVSTESFTLPADTTVNMIVHLLKEYDSLANAIVQLKITDLADPNNPQYGIYIFDDGTSGTNEQLPPANVKLYPNPVVESFTLENADAVSRVRVFSLDGRQVALFNAVAGQIYSLKDQPTGAYMVSLETKSGKFFQIIKVEKN